MKKTLLISAAFAILLITQSLMIMKKDGAAPGYTGSPGDGLKNCTECHGGTAVKVDDWISSDIPAEGYVPGETYTITASNNETGATRFGFEVSPQDTGGNLLGTMLITDSVETKLVGGTKYITYTENGVEGVNSKSWSFKWIAPENAQEVVFYGGFNSNFEGHKDGDKTYLSTLTVKNKNSTGISSFAEPVGLKIYPNPTYRYIMLDYRVLAKGNLQAEILDMNGRQVLLLLDGDVNAGSYNQRFDISTLANGYYLVKVKIDGKTSTQRLHITR